MAESDSSTYQAFLSSKSVDVAPRGLTDIPSLSSHLFPFQRACVEFGLRAGSFGLFLDTGLGKTACQLEWCIHAAAATNGRALLFTPLAVAKQIEREGRKWGYPVRVIRSGEDATDGINVCNYDRLHLLDVGAFGAVSLDESSILKNFTGTQSRALVESFAGHRFRCGATATPAPNDHTELAQHADFLGVMSRADMLVRFFINDSGDTKSWRLKGHAEESFFDWMASWARMAERPQDLGDDSVSFDLPPLAITRHRAEEPETPLDTGTLFGSAMTATSTHDVKRQTAEARASVVADLVTGEPGEPWLVWCDTDYEADALLSMLPDARDVRGSYSIDHKERTIESFVDGTLRVLVAKPSVCGFGLNLQHCARMAFVGRSFSYERWYQAVRRCWRFGQSRQVQVHLVVAEGEDAIGRVIDRKSDDHARLRRLMAAAMRRAVEQQLTTRRRAYAPRVAGRLPAWMGVAR